LQRVVDSWINWALPTPTNKRRSLDELIERDPSGVEWHTEEETRALLDQMSEANKRKLAKARKAKRTVFGTAYRRTRVHSGIKAVRTEVRFDGISGCLRTPAGGSSRQIVIEVNGSRTRSRLMTVREGARLMGLPETYVLPNAYNEGYHLVGDGVAVGVVRYLADSIFEPVIDADAASVKKAA
jgi:DNA (cytosine-5)-methyltransferase 1